MFSKKRKSLNKIFLIFVTIFYSNYLCQDYNLTLFSKYYPNVKEIRNNQNSTDLNVYGIKFAVDSFLPYSIISGIELKYGKNKFNTKIPEPIEGCAMGGYQAFLSSKRELNLLWVTIPFMYKVHDNLTTQINVGVNIGFSYFQLHDDVTRYPNYSQVKYNKSFTVSDYNWNVIPTIEINSLIKGAFFLFLGIDYNFKKANCQITSDSEILNNYEVDQVLRAVKFLGNKIEYDYRGISLSLGISYKI